jgi:hypothetical protein
MGESQILLYVLVQHFAKLVGFIWIHLFKDFSCSPRCRVCSKLSGISLVCVELGKPSRVFPDQRVPELLAVYTRRTRQCRLGIVADVS